MLLNSGDTNKKDMVDVNVWWVYGFFIGMNWHVTCAIALYSDSYRFVFEKGWALTHLLHPILHYSRNQLMSGYIVVKGTKISATEEKWKNGGHFQSTTALDPFQCVFAKNQHFIRYCIKRSETCTVVKESNSVQPTETETLERHLDN